MRSIVGITGFFPYDTCHPFLTQYSAAGEPDWVVGYATGFVDSDFDQGSVHAESTSKRETIRNGDRIYVWNRK